MKRIKVVQIGCGKMSKYIMRFIYEKDGEIVGAFDVNEKIIGNDIGVIMGTEEKGIKVSSINILDEVLRKTKPDVAIIATKSTLNEISNELRTCIKNSVNVLTTCEEAFFPENSNPLLYKELDTLAKAFNCTIIGCGYQDIFWGHIITDICGSTHKITKIKGVSSYNIEDYGLALANAHGAGLTVSEFESTISEINRYTKDDISALKNKREFIPSYMWNVAGWLADRLNIHITDIKEERKPIISSTKIESNTLNMTIDEGMCIGTISKVYAKTEEDILIEIECIGKIYDKDETDKNEWTIFGCPTTKLCFASPETAELTCADVVNRIPDIINAPKGFITTSKMASAKYIKESLND